MIPCFFKVMAFFNGFVAVLGFLASVVSSDLGSGSQFWGLNDAAPSFVPETADPLILGDGLYKDSALRDVEHLQHSSLWGHKYVGGT